MSIIIPTLSSLLFVVTLFIWHQKRPATIYLISALIISVLSAISWVNAFGIEFGLTYWFCSISLLSWLWISCKTQKIAAKNIRKQPHNHELAIKLSRLFSQLIQFLLVVLVPAITATAISFGIPVFFFEISANTLVFTLFLYVLIWPLIIYFYQKSQHKILANIVLLSSSSLLIITNPELHLI